MSDKFKNLRKISEKFSQYQLRQINEKEITLDFSELFETSDNSGSGFFLDYYSPGGINFAFEKYGIFYLLKAKGFKDIKILIETKNPYRQKLALYDEKIGEENLLCEIVLRRKQVTFTSTTSIYLTNKVFDLLIVEWLYSQNPREQFTKERPKLPGQKYPGLKTGKIILELLLITCKRLGLSGILNVPEHFHNAQIYSAHFSYINPEYEGKRQAITRDLLNKKYDLATVSWAIELECVYENTQLFKWFTSEQMIPIADNLKSYLFSEKYNLEVSETKKLFEYTLDEDCWNTKKSIIDDYICN